MFAFICKIPQPKKVEGITGCTVPALGFCDTRALPVRAHVRVGTCPHTCKYGVCIPAHYVRNRVSRLAGIMETEPAVTSVSQQPLR